MRSRAFVRGLIREIFASAVSQRTFTLVMFAVVASSIVTILLTSGRSEAAQEAVLKTIDAQGTRSISIQIKSDQAQLPFEVIDELSTVDQIQRVVAFGDAEDVTAAALPGGTRVALRPMYDPNPKALQAQNPMPSRIAFATPKASRELGMPEGAGDVQQIGGPEYQIVSSLELPSYLKELDPLVITPVDRTDGETVLTSAMVLARDARSIQVLTRLVEGYFADYPAESYSISTSEQLAELRGAVNGELSKQGRAIVTWVSTGTSILTLLIVVGFVVLRRKDFGRRRALGATRLTVAGLVVGQVALTACFGLVAGVTVAWAWLRASSGSVPSVSYIAAISFILVVSAATAALVPATVAATRDPMRELRVP